MSVIRFILLLFFCISKVYLSAQVVGDSAQHLKEVVIEGDRLNSFTTGNEVQKIDSATVQRYQAYNLGDLLSLHSHLFIKSYGLGNMSSISSRGTNASQTAVLWNGFNIQSPTLGQMDFSYFPISFADKIDIQYGGASALFGSGAVGGIVSLSSSPRFNTGLHGGISVTGGSFGNYQQSANIRISRQRFISSAKLFNFSAENDFPFYAGNQKVRQVNAKVNQKGLLFESFFRIRSDQQVNVRFWLQDNYRQIPPAMGSRTLDVRSLSNETLRSEFYRLSSEWKKTGKMVTYAVRTAYFNDKMNYDDTLAQMHTVTHFHTWITEAESIIKLGRNHLLNIGLNNTYNKAQSGGYPEAPSQNRSAVFGSYRLSIFKDKWRLLASVRQEMVRDRFIPFTPSAGLEGKLTKGLSLKGNVSRTFRVPTFNDLYWKPGGNENLKPESGWNEEISLIANPRLGSWKNNQIVLTLFNSNIENCIMWLPSGGTWSASNIQSVWSRGLESSFSIYKEIGDFKFSSNVFYSYVLSTNKKSRLANEDIVGMQLIYVPVYSARGTISIAYKGFYLDYVHSYTGNRYYTTDNSKIVPAYQLANLILGKNIKVRQSVLNINARVNNIYNESYQVVLNQAMPMRYYQVGATFYFNKPINTN